MAWLGRRTMSEYLFYATVLLGLYGVYVLLVCKDYNEKEINK